MARTKGAVNTSTMLRVINENGRGRPGLENATREEIRAIYESAMRAVEAGTIVKPSEPVVVTPVPKAPTPITPAAPPPPSEWMLRRNAAVARSRTKWEQNRRIAAETVRKDPPCSRDSLMDTTVIEGRTVKEWSDATEAEKETHRGSGYTSELPGWAVWAVRNWVGLGSPTATGMTRRAVLALLEKAERAENEAAKVKDAEQAAAKRAKAIELRKQADALEAAAKIAA